jgi:DNA-binding transcriptional regulator YhcF (GntR family)
MKHVATSQPRALSAFGATRSVDLCREELRAAIDFLLVVRVKTRPASGAGSTWTGKDNCVRGSPGEVLYAPAMEIDPASGWPLSAQLAQLLRELIRSGQLAPGDRVPSEPQLARDHAVSRDTAQRALAMLAEEGLITRRRGVGSIVAPVEPVTEIRAAPGARISARLPTAAERDAVQAGMWVPLLAVAEPGWPEQLYPADRVVVVVPARGDEDAAKAAPSAQQAPEGLPRA